MTGHRLQPEELRWRAFIECWRSLWFFPLPFVCPFTGVHVCFCCWFLVLFWLYASRTAWASASSLSSTFSSFLSSSSDTSSSLLLLSPPPWMICTSMASQHPLCLSLSLSSVPSSYSFPSSLVLSSISLFSSSHMSVKLSSIYSSLDVMTTIHDTCIYGWAEGPMS